LKQTAPISTAWEVERSLGKGGSGEVFLASNPQGLKVALKILTDLRAEQIGMFEREAQFLVKLRHPAIAGVLGYAADSSEIFGANRGPCFWMEFVEGRGVLEASKHASPVEVFAWLRDSLEALGMLHVESIYHGDLSPKNLLVTRDGQIKLIDFGLAGSFSSQVKLKAGTMAYLAPERMEGQNLPASDLFSLGTIFYEALAHRHPRAKCRSLHEMMRASATELLEASPGLRDFSVQARIVDRMIQIDPKKRFSAAQEALDALSGVEAKSPAANPAEYHSATMYGAEEHFKALESALREVQDQSRIFWLHGITGTGRSRFLHEAKLLCSIHGLELVEISPVEFQHKKAFLKELSTGKPRAGFFSSLESLDAESLLPLLSFKRGEHAPAGRIFILEYNDDGLSEASRHLLDRLRGIPGASDIHLKNLGPMQTRALLGNALGSSVSTELAEPLFQQTKGNPRLLLQMVKLLREKNVREKGHFSKEWIQQLQGLQSFEDILAFRVSGLEEREKQVLVGLAAAHFPVAMNLLERAWALAHRGDPIKPDALSTCLDSLIARELLAFDSKRQVYSLALPDLENVLSRLNSKQSKIWHQAWLETLPEEEGYREARLHHGLFLGDEALTANLAQAVVEKLQKQAQRLEALRVAERAQEIVLDPIVRSQILRLRTNLLIELRRFPEAIVWAEAAFKLAAADEPLQVKAVKFYLVKGLAHHNLGQTKEALRSFEQCLREAKGASDPESLRYQVRAYSFLGTYEMREGHREKAKEYFKEGISLAGPTPRQRAELLRNLAVAMAEEKDWDAAKKLLEEAKSLYRQEGHPKGEFATWFQEGNLALSNEDAEHAESAYREAERLALQCQDESFLSRLWNNRAVLARRRGDLKLSLELFLKAQEILRSLGNWDDLSEHLQHYAMAEAAVGHFARAEQILEELKTYIEKVPKAEILAEQLRQYLEGMKEGIWSEAKESPWDVEATLQELERKEETGPRIRALLLGIFQKLPVSLQVSFSERYDYQRWVENKIPRKTEDKGKPKKEKSSMKDFKSLSEINRALLQEDDMERVLEHLMDSAMSLSRAENGFLVLRSEKQEGPIPGFSVVVAKNVSRQVLQTVEFALSLSAIRQAMETGEPVVTDNALNDPRFSHSDSVQTYQLKSILALPINGKKGILGVFYLDHSFEFGLFNEDQLAILQAFSEQAALALQKGQMIEELKKANAHLVDQVEEQSNQLHRMQMELAENRLKFKYEYNEIIGRSPKMLEVLSLVDKITDAMIAVWIFGESGTGKESIARALHYNSPRSQHAFVTENCSALPESLMESELFGHKRGSFTHAVTDKIGMLEYANKGTVFLDEIADLSPNLQGKLLRFLQEGEIRPLGSNKVVKVDVRVVSASNRDLRQLVEQGKFREDLYFRLNGVTVNLPPLRERMEDLPLLVDHFLKKSAQRTGSEPPRLSMEVMRQFMNYPWPGNIRELQNTLETTALFAENGIIGMKALSFKPILLSKKKAMKNILIKSVAKEAMDPEIEKILLTLRDNGYHKVKAAKTLGISRRTLYTKLEKFGVPIEVQDLKTYIDSKFV